MSKGGRQPCVNVGDVVNGRKVIERLPLAEGRTYNGLRYLVQCTECGMEADVFGYSLKKSGCKSCASKSNGLRRRLPDEKKVQCGSSVRYRQGCRCDKCREHRRVTSQEYRKTDKGKEHVKRGNLSKFGITLEQFYEMRESQDNRCAICKKSEVVLCVDHCHDTNVVRGLLCHGCNRGIGLMGDSPENLIRAAEYLKA